MKEKVKKETYNLYDDELEEVLKRCEGIFKGGITVINPKGYPAASKRLHEYLATK